MKHKGFTIVELVIVIVVIGILAAITIVGYGAWRDRTAKTEVMSDLRNAALAMNSYRNFNNVYPTGATALTQAGIKESSNVAIAALSSDSNTLKYCLQASSRVKSSIIYYINSISKNPSTGACPALPADPTMDTAPPQPTGLVKDTNSDGEACYYNILTEGYSASYWTTVANSTAPKYNVYIDGILKKTITNPNVSAGGLFSGRIYTGNWSDSSTHDFSVSVRAVNANGTESTSANRVSSFASGTCIYNGY